MKTVPTRVSDMHGNLVVADMIVCPDCQESKFFIFMVGGHQHLQCAWCQNTFCDGTCEGAKDAQRK